MVFSRVLFLRRRSFSVAAVFIILLNTAFSIYEGIFGTDRLLFRIGVATYSALVALGLYMTIIRKLSVDSLLHAVYLNTANSVVLSVLVFLRFLLKFNASMPYKILIDNISALLLALASLCTAMFIITVRKYIVQSIVTPISIQRAKGIESSVVIIRREYPEIFQ
ncbi:hypothetical protein NECID01_1398 [Nematocida sp. AWRm77]|nr:hypothetical protein NECID01_1398 [Nematocida sp. AWRm77]